MYTMTRGVKNWLYLPYPHGPGILEPMYQQWLYPTYFVALNLDKPALSAWTLHQHIGWIPAWVPDFFTIKLSEGIRQYIQWFSTVYHRHVDWCSIPVPPVLQYLTSFPCDSIMETRLRWSKLVSRSQYQIRWLLHPLIHVSVALDVEYLAQACTLTASLVVLL